MNEPQVTIYTPDSSLARPGRMLRAMFRDLVAGRELAWRLAVRDIRAQYRQAFLGVLWAFIIPSAHAIAWIFLDTSGIVKLADGSIPYPVYAFSGTILWAIFMEALNAPLQQVASARGMLAKLNFPREALIVSGLYQILFNATIKIVLMFTVLLMFGIVPGLPVLLLPLGIFSLLLVGTTVGLLITPVGILYSDVGRAVPLLMQFLMFVTPVVFQVPKDGWAAILFECNPLTPLVLVGRDLLLGIFPPVWGMFCLVNVAALGLLLFVWAVYRLAMPILIERMNA